MEYTGENNFTYLVEPTGALKASPEQILCSTMALQGASIYFLQGLFPFLGPWPFASREMELALGIFYADVPPVTVWLSCLSHLQILNIKQVNVELGYVCVQTDRVEEIIIIHVCVCVCVFM